MRDRTSTPPTLVVVPSLRAGDAGSGKVVLTRKFIEGMDQYAGLWPGRVVAMMARSPGASMNLDNVAVDPKELKFGFAWLGGNAAERKSVLESAACVLLGLTEWHVPIGREAGALGCAVVYISETSLNTKLQIIRAETKSILRRIHHTLVQRRSEKKFRAAVKEADGIQCNGTPTHDCYGAINPRPLLFFDSRVEESMVVSESVHDERLRELSRGGPIRLGFSGRLLAIKGVDHLSIVASELKRMGVGFSLDICGDGPLEPVVRDELSRRGLEGQVRLRGVLDFRSELLPFVSRHIDLFVCCHRQGDPSCTYLETMSCGTPIVGYGNEAHVGVCRVSGTGWHTPMDDPRLLAEKIAVLSRDRGELARAAKTSRAFALEHTFERTMKKRVEHLVACAAARGGN